MARPGPTEQCYICRGQVGASGERDHFPTPKTLGGSIVLVICRTCHDMKDRIPLGKWDPAVAYAGLLGLWAKANRDERLILAKVFHVRSMSLDAGYEPGTHAHTEDACAHKADTHAHTAGKAQASLFPGDA